MQKPKDGALLDSIARTRSPDALVKLLVRHQDALCNHGPNVFSIRRYARVHPGEYIFLHLDKLIIERIEICETEETDLPELLKNPDEVKREFKNAFESYANQPLPKVRQSDGRKLEEIPDGHRHE